MAEGFRQRVPASSSNSNEQPISAAPSSDEVTVPFTPPAFTVKDLLGESRFGTVA